MIVFLRSGKQGLIWIALYLLAAKSFAAIEDHLEDSNLLTQYRNVGEPQKVEPDFEGDSALLEVLGGDDVGQNQVKFPNHPDPFPKIKIR